MPSAAMGCGASSARMVTMNVSVDSSKTLNLQVKPVLGVASASVVQGAPVHVQGVCDHSEFMLAEVHRKALIVQGLGDAAKASLATNPIAAAGFAMAAADVAAST